MNESNMQANCIVRNRLAIEMDRCKKREQEAIRKGLDKDCIEAYRKAFCLYAGFLAELD